MPTPLPTQSQVTAPVVEFRCLYTFNITQKRKKWQDGSLKFHLRNRRVMIYDESYNYIGDTHLQSAMDVDEGDEFDLQCGALVQVGGKLRTSESDITSIVQKSAKGNDNSISGTWRDSGKAPSQASMLANNSDKKHKSLRSILASQTSGLGRSDLQAVVDVFDNTENTPPSKRQRLDACRESVSWSVTATVKNPTQNAKSRPEKSTSKSLSNILAKRKKTLSVSKSSIVPGQSTLHVKQVIDLTSDTPPDPSLSVRSLHRASLQSKPMIKNAASKIPAKAQECARSAPPSSPPVRSSNTMLSADHISENEISSRATKQPNQIQLLRSKGRSLKLSKEKGRRTLLCMQESAQAQSQDPRQLTTPSDASQCRLDANDRLSRPADDYHTYVHTGERSVNTSDQVQADRDSGTNAGRPRKRRLARVLSDPSKIRVLGKPKSPAKNSSTPEPVSTSPVCLQEPITRSDGWSHSTESRPELILRSIRPQQHLRAPWLASLHPQPTKASRATGPLRRTQSAAEEPGGLNSGRIAASTNANISPLQSSMRRSLSTSLVGVGRVQQNRPVRQFAVQLTAPTPTPPPPPLPAPMATKPADPGPWSTEALDLFDWRPPDWEARLTNVPASAAMVD
jgi:Protein of unknown function (DUF2439)